jgi:hypothetical protein
MFFEWHPGLQSLHLQGGILKGKIQLNFGKGLPRVLGKRVARKLGVPLQPGEHELRVEIQHADSYTGVDALMVNMSCNPSSRRSVITQKAIDWKNRSRDFKA